mmetsp:Transcript_24540/g.72206  ORF Transcript_24540/g.72206 Transcript_24540/m.72206 type:complete len:370 (+) Transcript_24540:206-1315(+)
MPRVDDTELDKMMASLATQAPKEPSSMTEPVISVPRASPLARRPVPNLHPEHPPGAQLVSSSLRSPTTAAPPRGELAWPPAFGEHADQNKRHRRHMEDAPKVVPDLVDGEYAYFAIYDGHGGRTAVDFISDRLHENVASELQSTADACREDVNVVSAAISRAVMRTDDQLKPAGAYGCGSTAAIIVLQRLPACAAASPGGQTPRVLAFAANAGDSHIMLLGRTPPGVPPPAPVRLSVEHSGKNEEEVARVLGAGGFMRRGRVGCLLAVTRALGDHALKEDESGVGLTAEPNVCVHEVDAAADLGFLLVSDGVTEALDDEACDAIAREALAKGDGGPAGAQLVAKAVVEGAVERGSRDNISAVFVHLAPA